MPKRKKTPIEAFNALTPDQKKAEYRAVDRVFSRAETRPLSAENRAAWKKFRERRRRERGKLQQNAKSVSLRIDGGLLRRADALAKREGLAVPKS